MQSPKKLAFIGCFSPKNWYSFAPLVATLENSNLNQKYDIFLFKKRNFSAIKKILNQYTYSIMGYSFYTHEAPMITSEIKKIRKTLPQNNLLLLAGGSHASGNPKQTLQFGFDLVIKGEGESILTTLLERIWNNNNYLDIEGLCYRRNDKIHLSTCPELINLDEFPTFSRNFNLYPPIEITRGCPFGCKYCGVTYLFGKTMRHRTIKTILRIVKTYQEIFAGRRSTDIRFISPNSFAYGSTDGITPNVEKIHELLRKIHAQEDTRIFFASFPSETRPEFITSTILEEISPLISNTHIAFGAQSGSDRILKSIGRKHSVSDIIHANQAILDANLTPLIDFMLGLPGETIDDQYKSLDLIKKLIQKKAKIRIHYFMPLAGTPFEYMAPVPIHRPILSELGRLAKKGHVEGNLDVQVRKSNRIRTFLQSYEQD